MQGVIVMNSYNNDYPSCYTRAFRNNGVVQSGSSAIDRKSSCT